MERSNLLDDIKQYVKLSTDSYKLKFTRSLSTSFSSMLSIILVIAMLQMVLIALTIALVLLVGKLIGSYMVGAFIVTGLYLVILVILLACRKKLFRSTFIRMFLKDENIRSGDELDKQLMLNEVEFTKQEYEIKRDVDYIFDWKRYITPVVQFASQFLHKEKYGNESKTDSTGQSKTGDTVQANPENQAPETEQPTNLQ